MVELTALSSRLVEHENVHINYLIFTALHGMQTRSSDDNIVCPSNARIVTKRKKNQSRFFIPYERSFSL